MGVRANRRKSRLPISSFFKRVVQREWEGAAVDDAAPSPAPVEKSSKRKDPRVYAVDEGVEVAANSSLISDASKSVATRRSKSGEAVDKSARDVDQPKGTKRVTTMENRRTDCVDGAYKKGFFGTRHHRDPSPSPWGRAKRSESRDDASSAGFPPSLGHIMVTKETESKTSGQKGLTILEPNTKNQQSSWAKSCIPRKETVRPICKEKDTKNCAERSRHDLEASITSSAEEPSGLRIVVYDSENKSERRVRVIELDSGKTISLKGENIEPFLNAIFREALKQSQDIHIEKGGISDYSGGPNSPSHCSTLSFARAISFVKSGSKNGHNTKTPSDPIDSDFFAGGPLSQEYVKTVSSLNPDDGSIVHEVSVIADRIMRPERQVPPTRAVNEVTQNEVHRRGKPPLPPTTTGRHTPRISEDTQMQENFEASPRLALDDGLHQKKKNETVLDELKSDITDVNDSNDCISLPEDHPDSPSSPRSIFGTTKSVVAAKQKSQSLVEQLGLSQPTSQSSKNSFEAKAAEPVEPSNDAADSNTPAVDSFMSLALQGGQAFAEKLGISGPAAPLTRSTSLSVQCGSATGSSPQERSSAPNEQKASPRANGAELSRLSTSKVLPRECDDHCLEIVCGITSESKSPNIPVQISHAEVELPMEDVPKDLNRIDHAVSPTGPSDKTSAVVEVAQLEPLQQTRDDSVDLRSARETGSETSTSKNQSVLKNKKSTNLYHCSSKREQAQTAEDTVPTSTLDEQRMYQAGTVTPPVIQTIVSHSSAECSIACETQDASPPSRSPLLSLENPTTDPRLPIARPPPSEVAKRPKTTLLRILSTFKSKGLELKVLPLEKAKKVVEAAVERVVKRALDAEVEIETESSDEEASCLHESRSMDLDVKSSGHSSAYLDEKSTDTSSYLGSSEVPEDDSYWETSTMGYDDSTLCTSTLHDVVSWVQSQPTATEFPTGDVIISFSGSLGNFGSVAILSEERDGEIELVDEDEGRNTEIDRRSSHTRSVTTVNSATSEENAYNQSTEHSTPLMEAFVFYIESSLEKMKGRRKRKKKSSPRMNTCVDDNVNRLSEGLLHSFIRIMGKEETDDSGGGRRGLASTGPRTSFNPNVKEMDDWNDLVEVPTDDMMRAAFGVITTALTEEMGDFVPSRVMNTSRKE